ncbi:hypothetical protein PYW07_006757 [Mythimna separata]|uniref:Uncharacterized protein n=1 Tax=Mythimna separata TaxID=271217 RepID=A0AAD7YV52_MYTSE|nr:hypothetical protein PYW07_006757 [Mythimna separata]
MGRAARSAPRSSRWWARSPAAEAPELHLLSRTLKKCLDAHGGSASAAGGGGACADGPRGSLGAALKSLVGSLTGRRGS